MWITEDKIREIFEEHREHLIECLRDDDITTYWVGAIDCVDNLAEKLGVELE